MPEYSPELRAKVDAAMAKADKHGWAVDEDGDLVLRVPTCWKEGAWQDKAGRDNAAAIVALHNAFPALAAYTRALEAEVAALRRGLPLLKAIAAWESMNGTVAAITPSEHSSLCQLISEAAVEGSARAAIDASGDA